MPQPRAGCVLPEDLRVARAQGARRSRVACRGFKPVAPGVQAPGSSLLAGPATFTSRYRSATERSLAVRERVNQLGVDDRGPVEHEGDEHSLYFEDPEGNVVEVWDFFEDGAGADAGVSAVA